MGNLVARRWMVTERYQERAIRVLAPGT